MKRGSFAVALLLVLAMLLASCRVTAPEVTAEEPNGNYARNTTNTSATTFVISGINDLRRLVPETDGVMVMLTGYYLTGDSGKGLFYWDANETAPDNGGTVIAPTGKDTGRFVRVCESNYVNVKWFGAKGNGTKDDTAAIQAAIDSLPNKGGTVVIPGGRNKVTDTIHIGNGTANTPSDKNGIKPIFRISWEVMNASSA